MTILPTNSRFFTQFVRGLFRKGPFVVCLSFCFTAKVLHAERFLATRISRISRPPSIDSSGLTRNSASSYFLGLRYDDSVRFGAVSIGKVAVLEAG
ncbi:hypothetical protein HPP92_014028 [Vanilla planifolia]|uniref:Uncharacterized protein n=1 Tax=Vanilla planifolia TaxID=51239 RepID=A0A835QV11_VANPL|nr:hypothetical protein HPP92_014028 [Vanilla planifolia]